MKDNKAALNTVYSHNTRPGVKASSQVVSGWDPKIDRLLALDHPFLGYAFDDDGYLFRGMSNGLAHALSSGEFGYFADGRPQCQLEQDLDIFLVSHECSDALTLTRLWEQNDDSAVLVIPGKVFNAALAKKQAAVLGFADPGMVFKYPFFTQPLRIQDLAHIIVHPKTLTHYQRLVTDTGATHSELRNALLKLIESGFYGRVVAPELADENGGDRQAMERALMQLNERYGISGCKTKVTQALPRKQFEETHVDEE